MLIKVCPGPIGLNDSPHSKFPVDNHDSLMQCFCVQYLPLNCRNLVLCKAQSELIVSYHYPYTQTDDRAHTCACLGYSDGGNYRLVATAQGKLCIRGR